MRDYTSILWKLVLPCPFSTRNGGAYLKMNTKKSYTCLLCNQPIDDFGDNFCSKCRTKNWKLRFLAIKNAENQRLQTCKYKNSGRILNPSVAGYYAQRRGE